MRAGIIGPSADQQVVAVAASLRALDVEPVVLDLGRFPGALGLTVRDGVPDVSGLEVTDVSRWYVRSMPLALPFAPARVDDDRRAQTAYAAGRERRSFVAGFVAALVAAGAELVNPPAALAQHFRKLEQLDALRAAGVPVPVTLATNDPDAVVAFAAEHPAGVVYKPLAGGALARRLVPADLDPTRLALLGRAPVLFQEEVPGRNVRVYVVGGEVVAVCEICSDALDYRGAETAVRVIEATATELDACRRAAAACEMALAGIDVKRRLDGSFAVLECNPSPMFAAIERRTGATPVSDAIAVHIAGDLELGAGTPTIRK